MTPTHMRETEQSRIAHPHGFYTELKNPELG